MDFFRSKAHMEYFEYLNGVEGFYYEVRHKLYWPSFAPLVHHFVSPLTMPCALVIFRWRRSCRTPYSFLSSLLADVSYAPLLLSNDLAFYLLPLSFTNAHTLRS
jgi:hypothetical protein